MTERAAGDGREGAAGDGHGGVPLRGFCSAEEAGRSVIACMLPLLRNLEKAKLTDLSHGLGSWRPASLSQGLLWAFLMGRALEQNALSL